MNEVEINKSGRVANSTSRGIEERAKTGLMGPSGFACVCRGHKLGCDMPPPLLLLQDISLTFGGTPLLTGARLAVAAGDRICLVGRNGSGKSTLLQIAAGLVQPDAGERFAQPGATISYLPQEPDLTGFATTLAYVEAGFGAGAPDRHRALYLLKELGLSGEENPAALSGGEARRAALARALAPLARHPAARRADQPSRPARHRVAGARAGPDARRHRADQP